MRVRIRSCIKLVLRQDNPAYSPEQKEGYFIVQLNIDLVFHLKIKTRSTNLEIIREKLVIL